MQPISFRVPSSVVLNGIAVEKWCGDRSEVPNQAGIPHKVGILTLQGELERQIGRLKLFVFLADLTEIIPVII